MKALTRKQQLISRVHDEGPGLALHVVDGPTTIATQLPRVIPHCEVYLHSLQY